MFKVIIADDEPLIRNRLKQIIDWKALGFEVVGEADNGLQALEMAKANKPDLIISDMKMPNMDGVQLMEALRQSSIDSRVIVLSAYSGFNYTRAAIKQGAYDYLLKPLDVEELKRVLLQIKSELQVGGASSDLTGYDNTGFLQTDSFLSSFKPSVFIDKTGIKSEVINFQMNLDYDRYLTAAVRIIDLSAISDPLARLAPEVSEIMSVYEVKTSFFINPLYQDMVFLVLGSYKEFPPIDNLFGNIKRETEHILNQSVSIGVGNLCINFNQIAKSFNMALDALSYRRVGDEYSIIYGEEVSGVNPKAIAYESEKERAFLTALEICNWSEMSFNIKAFFKYIKEQEGISFRQVYKLCSELLFMCDRLLKKYDSSLETLFDDQILSVDHISRQGTVEKLEQWFTFIIKKIMNEIANQKHTGINNIIDDIVKYIQHHYYENLSLGELSEKYHINNSYLSTVFKKRMGTTFSKYLLATRISKAQELMNNPKLKVYEIAEMVGYSDVKHFSKVFKKQVGITPKAYRTQKG